METDNRNLIIKGLALILIAILAINVYRTETTKKEMATLSETVSQIQDQLDSLQMPSGDPAKPADKSNKQPGNLEKKISNLESKISKLQNTVEQLSKTSNQTTKKTTTNSGTTSDKTPTATAKVSTNGRISVSAKAKVENRYVSGTTYVPKITTGPTGVVIINVTMDRIGKVVSVSVNSGSTITDEDIIDLCKEAALKTDFSYNPDAQDKTKGTITYTFTAK